MPATIYALSYKDTGSILSYCMLEKQKLVDKPAVNALLDRIVGENLILSLKTSSGAGFTIPKADLVVDELTIDTDVTRDQFVRAPHGFVLDTSDPTKLGDGSPKKLGTPLTVTSYTLNATAPQSFVVKLANQLGPTVNGYVFVEGLPVVAAQATSPLNAMTFPFAPGTLATKLYAVIFVAQGITPFFGFQKAV